MKPTKPLVIMKKTMEHDTHYEFNLSGKLRHLSPVRLSKIFNPRSKDWSYYSEPIAPTINYEMRWEKSYKDEIAFVRAIRNYTKKHHFIRMWNEPAI